MYQVFRSIQGFTSQGSPGGPMTVRETIDVTRPNPHPQARAVAVLRGFDIEFMNGDHHLFELIVMPRIERFTPQGTSLDFAADVGVRDSSGNWDDAFRGNVEFQIVVIDAPEVSSQTDVITLASGPQGGRGPIRGDGHFSEQVVAETESYALMSGFTIRYQKEDHHLLQMGCELHVESRPAGAEIQRYVTAGLSLRDSSGDWDDAYGGSVAYALLTFPKDSVNHAAVQFGYQGKADFPTVTRGSGPHSEVRDDIAWPGVVPYPEIIAGVFGWKLGFTGDDHHFGRALCKLEHQLPQPGTSPTRMHLTFEGGLRDWSGDWDDPYTAEATYHLIGPKHDSPLRRFIHLRPPG